MRAGLFEFTPLLFWTSFVVGKNQMTNRDHVGMKGRIKFSYYSAFFFFVLFRSLGFSSWNPDKAVFQFQSKRTDSCLGSEPEINKEPTTFPRNLRNCRLPCTKSKR